MINNSSHMSLNWTVHWKQTALKWFKHDEDSEIEPLNLMTVAEKDYSDQLGLYYQLLIFNLINFLFVKGIELYCMPPLAAMINTAYSSCRPNLRTTLDSFRL